MKETKKGSQRSLPVVEIQTVSVPRGNFMVRRNSKNGRALPRQIARLIEKFMEDFYTRDLEQQGLKHSAASIYDITAIIGVRLDTWLTNVTGKLMHIPAGQLLKVMAKMEIAGCTFEIRYKGYEDAFVRLRHAEEELMEPDVSFKAPGGKSHFFV